jgi:hypothetical protein
VYSSPALFLLTIMPHHSTCQAHASALLLSTTIWLLNSSSARAAAWKQLADRPSLKQMI